jgi:DNA-binding NtrC family response regulator
MNTANENLTPEPGKTQPFVGKHPMVLTMIENLNKIADSNATVLIQGESGTGKEVLAHMLHEVSPRKNKPFIAINCAALPDNLLESELFGHEKGSFTGAVQRQIGKFEQANGGTIFLDEISEMSLSMQTKLLRVLQEHVIHRVGGSDPIPLDIRIVAATNRNLLDYTNEGNFREDLYYRINVVPINVPPLRERGDDVLLIAKHYLRKFSKMHNRPELEMDDDAKQRIQHQKWRGNVRELRNAIERAILIGSFDQIASPETIPPFSVNDNVASAQTISISDLKASPGRKNTRRLPGRILVMEDNQDLTLAEVEKRVIFETLRRYEGNRTRTAEKLGISLRALRNKLKNFREQEENHSSMAH